jgi:hypothetical protein
MEDEGDIADAEGESDGTVYGLGSMAQRRKKSSHVDRLKAEAKLENLCHSVGPGQVDPGPVHQPQPSALPKGSGPHNF